MLMLLCTSSFTSNSATEGSFCGHWRRWTKLLQVIKECEETFLQFTPAVITSHSLSPKMPPALKSARSGFDTQRKQRGKSILAVRAGAVSSSSARALQISAAGDSANPPRGPFKQEFSILTLSSVNSLGCFKPNSCFFSPFLAGHPQCQEHRESLGRFSPHTIIFYLQSQTPVAWCSEKQDVPLKQCPWNSVCKQTLLPG